MSDLCPLSFVFRHMQMADSLQPEEVLQLCDELRPEGLALWMETALPPDDLDALFEQFCKRYA